MPRRKFKDVPHLEWSGQYILGGEDGHTPIPCYSLIEWGRWLQDANRVVSWTGGPDKCVSTVFLGLDHRHFGRGPPLVFETMLFLNGKGTDEMDRYSSWDDAEIGHKAFVRKHLVDRKTRVKTETDDDA
jgi:hypothetical protein